MPSYYTYLISSLPALYFGVKSPFSLDEFLNICSGTVSIRDLDRMRHVLAGFDYQVDNSVIAGLKEWGKFNLVLRNELVKPRAARKKVDPMKYSRADTYAPASITHLAVSAYRSHNILEAEKMLDLERWRMLDEVSRGHYFDIVALITYALKLKILVRWDKIRNSDKNKLLEEVLK